MGRRSKGNRQRDRDNPKPLRMGPRKKVPVSDLHVPQGWAPKGAVPASEREGVYVHSFMCNDCNLHFNLYSWKAAKHGAGNVTCPECGQSEGRFRHFRAIINESEQMTLDGPREIYGHVEYPGSAMMDDSAMPDLGPRLESEGGDS